MVKLITFILFPFALFAQEKFYCYQHTLTCIEFEDTPKCSISDKKFYESIIRVKVRGNRIRLTTDSLELRLYRLTKEEVTDVNMACGKRRYFKYRAMEEKNPGFLYLVRHVEGCNEDYTAYIPHGFNRAKPEYKAILLVYSRSPLKKNP